jgi:trans-aconitate 2-methyltransferase
MASPWKPEQYERFRDERSQPFFDLLKLVRPVPGGRAVDLGCGTGSLTRELHRASQAAETLGLDSSETMLAKSSEFAGEGLRFEQRNIADFAPKQPFDVVFSNAALQWIDGHAELFPRICDAVAPGGQLAVQMPANNDYASHQIAFAVAKEEPFRTALNGYARVWPVQPPEWYAELLDRLGFKEQEVRLQVYGHHLESREGVIEWVKGTLLTDYEKRMPPETYQQYLARYKQRLFEHLEDRRPFFYPFKRILVWGRKGDAD